MPVTVVGEWVGVDKMLDFIFMCVCVQASMFFKDRNDIKYTVYICVE